MKLGNLFVFLFWTIFFTFCSLSLPSQNYYCYTPEGKKTLPISTNKIRIKFSERLTKDQIFAILQKQNALSGLQKKNIDSITDNAVLTLPKGFTRSKVRQLLQGLKEVDDVEYAHPFFELPYLHPFSFGETLVVKLSNPQDFHKLQQQINQFHLQLFQQNSYDKHQYHLKTTKESPKNALEIANTLTESKLFAWTEVDFFYQMEPHSVANSPVNDPFFTNQWHLNGATQIPGGSPDADIDGPEAWCITTGNPNIKIAIIEGGLLETHIDIAPNLLLGYSAITGAVGSVHPDRHGTSVAGLAAGKGNNSESGAGVAFTSKIIPVQIFNFNSFSNSWAADGIDWAWKHGGADVLNNSWGDIMPSFLIDDAISRAVTKGRGGLGCIVVFSAGNDFVSSAIYPSSNSSTISVGSSDPTDRLKRPGFFDGAPMFSYGSNHGTGVDVYAPGTIMTTATAVNNTSTTMVFNGTSSAAPLVSGIAALVLSKNPGLTGSQVRAIIETSCEKTGGYTYNSNVFGQPNGTWSTPLGYGRVNAHAALLATPAAITNDVGVQQILGPDSDCSLSATQQATVLVKNYGTATQSNIGLEYRLNVNGAGFGAWQSAGTLVGPLASFSEVQYNFTINAAAIGEYIMEVRTILAGDGNATNDATACDFIHRQLINTFPYMEDFESSAGGWYTLAYQTWEWGTPAAGNGNTFIMIAGSGNKCWATNLNGDYEQDEMDYLYSPCLDFSGMILDPILSFQLIHHTEPFFAALLRDYAFLEASTDGGTSWNQVGTIGNGTNWYNHSSGWTGVTQEGPNGWVNAAIYLFGLAGNANVQLRFGIKSNGQNQFEGMGIDAVKIFEPRNANAGILQIKTPQNNCCLNNTNVTVSIQNLGFSSITVCPIEYRYAVNGGAFTAWVPAGNFAGLIPLANAADYIFPINLPSQGNYILQVRTNLTGDSDASNDMASHSFEYYNPLNTYPYSESFESGAANWWAGGTNRSWDLGVPNGSQINSAHDGSQAWCTGLSGQPNWSEQSWVQSPCFDFSALTQPEISLRIILDNPSSRFAVNLSYSTDGITWQVLGNTSAQNNWYDQSNTMPFTNTDGWQTRGSGNWVTAKFIASLLAGQSKVWFRLNFEGIFYNNEFDGFAFDKFEIKDLTGPGDAGVTAISDPNTRYCFSLAEPVNVTIENFGAIPLNTIPIEYRINLNSNGFSPWQPGGIYHGNLTSGNTAIHTFAVDFSISGDYVLEVRTNLPGDGDPTNDTASKSFSNLGFINTFPYSESFESDDGKWFSGGANSSWAHGDPSIGIQTIRPASDGNNIWATNLTGNNNLNEESWLQSPCFDFTFVNAPQISLDVWYYTGNVLQGANLQYSTDGGNTWTTLGVFNDPNNWYNTQNICNLNGDGWTGQAGGWLTATHTLNALAGQGDVVFRIRFSTCTFGQREGIGIDQVLIIDANTTDVGITSIDKPNNGCNFSANQLAEVKIRNFGGTTITSIPINYDVNFNGTGFNGWLPAGTWTGSLASGASTTFQFALNLSQAGSYEIKTQAALIGDSNISNDERSKTISNYGSSISVFPYTEDFENTNGDWTVQGSNPSWVWGTPNGATINAASKGAKAWATNLMGNHNPNETSWIQSPCLDFTLMNFGCLSFDIWYETETAIDGFTVEYSIDGGVTWLPELGLFLNSHTHTNISALNSSIGTPEGWSGSGGQWKTVQLGISPLGSPEVLYRFVFASNGSNEGEGVAIDNIMIFDISSNPVAASTGCQTGFVRGLSGRESAYILNDNGQMIAWVNANGNDLGTVTAEVNVLSGVPQGDNNVFYLPRYFNMICSGPDCAPAIFPNGSVGLNLYFQQSELSSYNTANSSSAINNDLYLTHYSGINENCSLNDDANTTFSIIDKVNITPTSYNSGLFFYLSFATPSFSEFGSHSTPAPLAPPAALPVELIEFKGVQQEKKNVLYWKTATEKNTQQFEIERSYDGKQHWHSIGTVQAKGFSNQIQHYQFEDKQPITSAYYRLHILDFDGAVDYSNIIYLQREEKVYFEVYPNPSKGNYTIYAPFFNLEEEKWQFILFDHLGKKVKQWQLSQNSSSFDWNDLQNGVYELLFFSENGITFNQRIVKM